eukprot:GEZU01024407.1.p1 GENE.GEZU01024407.1~~GEZU01024407.1.p1  ORF type:complete len:145 (-),score=12.17 GEZU01024407.1:29-463(-)
MLRSVKSLTSSATLWRGVNHSTRLVLTPPRIYTFASITKQIHLGHLGDRDTPMSFPSTLSNVTNGATKPIVQQQQRMFQHRAPTTTINPFARFTNSSLSQLETIQRNQHRNNTHNNHQHRRNFNANRNKLARGTYSPTFIMMLS